MPTRPIHAQQKQSFGIQYGTVFLTLLLTTLHLNCIVPADEGTPEFTFAFASQAPGDTLPPFGTITLAFSDCIDDSSAIALQFTPEANGYYLMHNNTRDTVTIVLTDPLQGAARYALRPATRIESCNAASLSPQTDSLIFYTSEAEQEPNGTFTTADTMSGCIFGSITSVSDTDLFMLPEGTSAIAVTSYSTATAFSLPQQHSNDTAGKEFRWQDTLSIPTSLSDPIFISACSYGKSAGGFYKITIIKK